MYDQQAAKVCAVCLPDGSGVNREVHAPFYERPEVKFLRPTRPGARGPEVLADFQVEHEIRQVGCGEDDIGAEWDRLTGKGHLDSGDARTWRKPPVLVVLSIVGQERFGDDP